MSIKLLIFNPSSYHRKGIVTTLWQPIFEIANIPAEELVIRDPVGNQLPMQIYEVDPADPSRTLLTFSLEQEVAPGPEDYSSASSFVTLERGKVFPEAYLKVTLGIEGPEGREHRVLLGNSRLQLSFNLTESLSGGGGNWYAGSATSVLLDGKEILDAFRAELNWIGHDLEKRCMQVDKIQLSLPAWAPNTFQEVPLFNQPYDLVTKSVGTILTSITIASAPFDYNYIDPFGKANGRLVCRLYRVITLYKDVNYILENLYIKGVSSEPGGTGLSSSLTFKSRYFSYMDMGLDIDIAQFARIPEWFAIGFHSPPYQGYGFAANVPVGPVASPHPEFPESGNEHKSFSWELGLSKGPKCIHHFSRSPNRELESQVGKVWYDVIYKPLKAEIVE